MTELVIIALVFLTLYLLLLVLNYKAFTKYPDRLKEYGLGRSILESKGPLWFIIIKATIFLVFFLVFITLSLFFPSRYSYLLFGVLLGALWFNLFHDYIQYKRAEESEQKG